MKISEIKKKFTLFCEFMKDHVDPYCISDEGRNLMIIYSMSYSMLEPKFLCDSMKKQFQASGITMEPDVLYDRLMKTFQIDQDKMPEESKAKLLKWLTFILEVINELAD